MKISFTAQFKPGDIVKLAKVKQQNLELAIVQRLEYIGESFVKDARENVSAPFKVYQDQTGNLRSSIGYVIIKDGHILKRNLNGKVTPRRKIYKRKKRSQQMNEVLEGVDMAEKLIDKIIRKHSKGYCLIVVAGMQYAGYVESKGYNVITMQGIETDNKVKKLIEDLKKFQFKITN